MNFPIFFEPITELNILSILFWYFVFLVSAGLATSFVIQEQTTTDDFSLTEVAFAGPLEEMLFRGLPIGISITLGLDMMQTVVLLLIANGIWAGSHTRSKSAAVFTFVFGIFLTRFWMEGFDGLWWMAILIHSLHNILVVSFE